MISQEQKQLAIALYQKGTYSIKSILAMTGIRSEQTLYHILDTYGIPRQKRKVTVRKISICLDERTAGILESKDPQNLSEFVCEAIQAYNFSAEHLAKMRMYLLDLCKLYHGEMECPWDQEKDEFKWYIWKREWAILKRCCELDVIKQYSMQNNDDWEEYFKSEIQAAIDLYADQSFGGKPEKWYKRYFEF